MWFRVRPHLVGARIGGALLGLAAASCTSDRPEFLPFHHPSGIAFDHPTRWALHDASATFTGGSVIAVLGTLPVPFRCGAEHVDVNCYYEQKLAPGTISIVVGTGSFGGATLFDERAWDPLEIDRERTEVGGLPAIVHRYGPGSYYEQDEAMGWEIAFPRSVLEVYGIEARLRGPGLPAMRAQLGRLIASIRIDGVGPPLDARPEAAAAAVRKALGELDRSVRRSHVARPEHVSWYSCFPASAAVTAHRVISLGPAGPLDRLRAVACRWTAVPEGHSFWRVTLELDGGRYAETLWVTPDGAVAGSQHAGIPPGGRERSDAP
jgi:hypothetical protein